MLPGQKVVEHNADHEPCISCLAGEHNNCDEQCGHENDCGTHNGDELCHGPCNCQCRKPLSPEEVMKLRALIGVLER